MKDEAEANQYYYIVEIPIQDSTGKVCRTQKLFLTVNKDVKPYTIIFKTFREYFQPTRFTQDELTDLRWAVELALKNGRFKPNQREILTKVYEEIHQDIPQEW